MTRGSEIPGRGSTASTSSATTSPTDPGYTVTENNIHLESSFRVRKGDFERELKALREQNPESQVWNRSIDSLKREWAAYNAFHAMGIFRSRTAHMDLNWPQPWFIRLGYAIIGRIAWPFIK